MAPKPKKARRESENSKVLNWTDNEVELLFSVVLSYSSQKDFDGLEWKHVRSKHEDIRGEFVRLYDERNHQERLPTHTSLFSREGLASKIKDLRKKYKKAVDQVNAAVVEEPWPVSLIFDILFSLRFRVDVPPQQILVMTWIQPILESL